MMIAMTTKRATTTPAAIAVELLDLPPLELCGVAVARDTPPGMDETLVPLTVMAVVLTVLQLWSLAGERVEDVLVLVCVRAGYCMWVGASLWVEKTSPCACAYA